MTTDLFTEETARRFWQEQRQRVQNAEGGETLDFSEMFFPKDPSGEYFHNITFHSDADFSGATFLHSTVFSEAIFEQSVVFENCKFPVGGIFMFTEFRGDAELGNVVFEDKARFAGVVFKQDANFSNSTFKSIVAFESEETPPDSKHKKTEFEYFANFDNCIWKEHVQFLNVIFHDDAFFQNGAFEYNALFDRCDVKGTTNFENVRFLKYSGNKEKRMNRVRLLHNIFNGKVTFRNSHFDCPARFVRNHFQDQAEFRKVIFGDSVLIERTNHFCDQLFLDEHYKSFSRSQDAIEPYRVAKQTAYQAGDLRWAGRYHYQEQCASNEYERKLSIWKPWCKEFWRRSKNGFLLWGEFIIGRGLFGYGEKPLRPLAWAGIVIIVCAALFWLNCGIQDEPNCGFGNALYFSIVTFTTLGYGDFKPIAGMRWLSGTEAILGAALMALFIVALSRKFSR